MILSIINYLKRGPSTSKEIQAATGLSQSTISRQIRDMGDRIVKIQIGRTVKYAATCNAFNSNDKIPLSVIDNSGKNILIAYVRPLNSGGFFLEQTRSATLLFLGEQKNGVYDDLPYFLLDLKPQGFLGRQIAQKIASLCDDFPSDPRDWNSSHIGRYLIADGDDLPGDFILGEQAFLRLRQQPAAFSEKDYPEIANRVMSGELAGSSAGGEQPKFTVFNRDTQSHVIVKFSPQGENEIATRWRDVLITEYHAAKIINDNIFLSATSRLLEMNGRLFLESQRLDRIGLYGRSSMISLQVIDAEYVGLGSNWPKVMRTLFNKRMVHEQDVLNAETVWYFGRLINNTDMHLGNLSLSIDGDFFKLLPIYDMCSMGFAPKSGGEVTPFTFEPPPIKDADINEEQLETITKAAHIFWKNVAQDGRISNQFKKYLQQGMVRANGADIQGNQNFLI
ncbi:MAG: type II toxin-antitoxin system HipA family toxin YjjJ [Desulfobacterium sp.]|jgi:hypothetical protein|nr:type II toxin-antitoxin system HipA family toxin YjjJ [Desulfobacterium sp.]